MSRPANLPHRRFASARSDDACRYSPRLYPILMLKAPFAAITAVLFMMLASVASYGADPSGPPLVSGSDPAEVRQCPDGAAYVYPVYIIYTRKSPYFEGQDIYVFKPRGPVADPCALASREAWYTINAGEFGGANTFVGMHGVNLFIDEWPGRDHKRLLVVDADKKSLVYFDWYADPAIEGGTLRYNRVLKASKSTKKEMQCPDAEKWEKEGFAVLYVEKMTLDLGTMKETHSGNFFCESAAPITKRAPDYTIH